MEFPLLESCLQAYLFFDIDIIMPVFTDVFDTFQPISCDVLWTFINKLNRTNFMDATEVEIRNIVKLSPTKSCELDPLPTWLLKECIAELVPTITDIVNMSLRDSLMPKSLKTALIRPLLKKTGLDSDILKNYRPVFNIYLESH